MHFLNPAQELTYRKVGDYLTSSALFKDQMKAATDEPTFCLTYGSAKVEIEVLAWEVHPWETRELAIVRACSCVTVETETTPELMHYLLTENSRMRFGAFHLGDMGEVRFSDSVLGGENMDLMELQTCILSVVTIADTYDDWIAEQFGGKRAVNLDSSAHLRDLGSNTLSETCPKH
ncbi:T3SS (YopN, CesT) and YbjN peptide-binding chaperone 1 [Leptolyngbya ohadii]|uniref:T3SS (YopN, CesT) and YbjN peptide-binding chaperone 1 n=1 Tax=Leptolyngbya ohadii TaxID=1962290 RepID=UPI000B59A95F|nr:YbjN domain-containing protein [Leptolyngbya ohadii]